MCATSRYVPQYTTHWVCVLAWTLLIKEDINTHMDSISDKMKFFSLDWNEVSQFSSWDMTILVTRQFGHSFCRTSPFVMHDHPLWVDKFHANDLMTFVKTVRSCFNKKAIYIFTWLSNQNLSLQRDGWKVEYEVFIIMELYTRITKISWWSSYGGTVHCKSRIPYCWVM